MKDFMKCVALIWTFVALMTFVVSCSSPPIVTEEQGTILSIRKTDEGVLAAVSIEYHGETWLQDIRLRYAEYEQFKEQNYLPLKARFIFDDSSTDRVELYISGRCVDTIYVSRELTAVLLEKLLPKDVELNKEAPIDPTK